MLRPAVVAVVVLVPALASAQQDALPDLSRVGREYQKTATVWAVKMDRPFEVVKPEATLPGKPGDYLVKGANGELWPMKAWLLERTYRVIDPPSARVVSDPVGLLPDPETAGGRYGKIGPVRALQMRKAFTVDTPGGPMRGRPGDYLVQGPGGERWIAIASAFEATYERVFVVPEPLPRAQVPAEYLAAERAARQALEALGVDAKSIEVVYHARKDFVARGRASGNRILINVNYFPANVKTVFHEFWHVVQQRGFGGFERAMKEYGRSVSYEANPFEREARLAADVMEGVAARTGGEGRGFRRQVARELKVAFPRMRALWGEAGIEPVHLRALGRGTVAREATGAAQFAGAYLLKEGLNAVETGDPKRMEAAVRGMAMPQFLGSWAMFTGIGHGVNRILTQKKVAGAMERTLPRAARTIAGSTLAAAVAIPAVEYAFGERDLGKIARTTAIFTGLSAAMDLPVILGMIAVPGPGTAVGAAYFTIKLALLLWGAEKIEAWIAGEPGGRKEASLSE